MSSQQINATNHAESTTRINSCCLINKWNTLSSNVKGLTLSTVLFTGISVAQVIFALSVNSIALLADAAAMFVDVACYLAAIYGETIKNPSYKRVYSLVVSFISMAILFGLSIYFLHESIVGLTTMPEIEWSQIAAEENNNPFADAYGRNASGVVQFGLPETVKSLEKLSTLPRRVIYNGIGATIHNGILPYGETHESACPDLGPLDSCDMDDAADSGTVMLAFGLVGLIIDLICLGYAFLIPRICKNKQEITSSTEQQEGKPEEDSQDGETQNVNTLAAYAHVAADLVRSFSSIVAASYIIASGHGAEYADDVAGAVSSCTIVLGSLVGLYEWVQELREHRAEKQSNKDESTTNEDSAIEEILSELDLSSSEDDNGDNTTVEVADLQV